MFFANWQPTRSKAVEEEKEEEALENHRG